MMRMQLYLGRVGPSLLLVLLVAVPGSLGLMFIPKESNRTSTNGTEIAGSSRGAGGFSQKGHMTPWIVILWRNPGMKEASGDGLMTGLGVAIRNNWLIMDMEAQLRAADTTGNYPPEFIKHSMGNYPSYVQFFPTDEIDVTKGMKEFDRVIMDLNFMLGLGGNMGLFYIQSVRYNGFFKDPLERLDPAASPLPVIQRDKSASHYCLLYTYSFERGSNKNQVQNKRVWSRWGVKLKGCDSNDNICTFVWDEGEIVPDVPEGKVCSTWSDVGAPIVCGAVSVPPLSYIVIKKQNANKDKSDTICHEDIRAVRLADHHQFLSNPREPSPAVKQEHEAGMKIWDIVDVGADLLKCGLSFLPG